MNPRKAVLIACMLMFGTGALCVGFFGHPLYLWYLTGDIEVNSMKTGLTFGHTTYREAPLVFVFQFVRQAAYCALGIFLLAAAVIVPIYHWKRLFRTDSDR
jgi:ABC-type transport system involved in cytochrome c biogenesis permease subunit